MIGSWFVDVLRDRGVQLIYMVSAGMVLIAGALYAIGTRSLAQNKSHSQTRKVDAIKPPKLRHIWLFILGWATDRWGAKMVIRCSVVLAILGSIVLALPSASLPFVIIGAILVGLGLASIYPILIASVANLFPDTVAPSLVIWLQPVRLAPLFYSRFKAG